MLTSGKDSAASTTKPTAVVDEAEKLDKLIEMMYQDLLSEGGRFKTMELLKALEFKRKIAPPDDKEGAFWEMIDELRASELKQSPPQSNSERAASNSPGEPTLNRRRKKQQAQ